MSAQWAVRQVPINEGRMWIDAALTGSLEAALDREAAVAFLARAVQTPSVTGTEAAFAELLGDEESGEPGSGVSAGIKRLVEDIETGLVPRPDFAVYVEPTQLDVFTAQMGFLICDITVTGRSAYFGMPEAGVDALKAAHAILG